MRKVLGIFLTFLIPILLLLSCSGGKEAKSSDGSSTASKTDNDKEGTKEKKEKKGIEEKLENVDVSKRLQKKIPDSLIQKGEKAEPIQKDRPPMVMHKRTPCLGQCPVYTLRIWPGGTAELKAERFTEVKKGTYRGKVPESKIERIKGKAKEIGFFELDKVYDNKGITDIPSRITKLDIGERAHRVRNRYGGPKGLESLEKLLARIVDETRWKALPSDE